MKTIILMGITITFMLVLVGFQKSNNLKDKMDTTMDINQKDLSEATFAGGCFWCTESDFEKFDGVVEVISGYVGGQTQNPTYQESRQVAPGMLKRFESDMIHNRSPITSCLIFSGDM